MQKLTLALALSALVACGTSPGGSSSGPDAAADAAVDAGSVADVSPTEDTRPEEDVVPEDDTAPEEDVAPPEDTRPEDIEEDVPPALSPEELAELCEIVAVKVGAHGSYIAHAGIVEKIEPVHAARVIDTTGAGDLWAAGFLYGWSQKRPLPKCAELGSILGAAVVQEQGSVLPENVWQDILSNI